MSGSGPGSPPCRSLDRAEAGVREAGGFGTPHRLRVDWEVTASRDAFLDRVPTSRGHDRIAPEKLSELLAGLGDAIEATGGMSTMRYATLALVTPLRATRR